MLENNATQDDIQKQEANKNAELIEGKKRNM